MNDPRDYEIHIWYSRAPGDLCFIAQVAEWPTITAHGETREEAAREIQVALELALGSAKDAGIEPPAPRLAHA
ncbi:MAG: type II toxin-antitoxin system HicB family antitoxin [Chthoniobacteraceae bacterium]